MVVDRVGRPAEGRTPTPKISASSDSSQYRTGVPRKTCQCEQSSRQTSRAGVLGERALPDPESLQRHPGGVQQPGDVMVGGHEQLRRVAERCVVQQQSAGRRDRAER